MDVPNIKRNEYQLINIEDGFLSLMLESGETKEDVKLPEGELGDQIQADFDEGKDLIVGVVSAMGEEHCLSGMYIICCVTCKFHSLFFTLHSQGGSQISLILCCLHLDICLMKIKPHWKRNKHCINIASPIVGIVCTLSY